MIYYAVKIHQLSPAQHITETQEEIILLWCEPTSYCTITEAQSYRWCSGGKMACFLSTGTVLLTAKPSSPVMSRCNHCIFPVYSFVYMFPSLRRTNCAAPSESDPVWLNACKHFLSLHTIQRVHINPKEDWLKPCRDVKIVTRDAPIRIFAADTKYRFLVMVIGRYRCRFWCFKLYITYVIIMLYK